VKLTFLGTRGYTEPRNPRHMMHSSMKVSTARGSITIDCGEDWLGRNGEWDTDAILVTHAHPDHAWGLKAGAPCPVYATADSWLAMANFKIEERREVDNRHRRRVAGITFEAFRVEHSTRAPAVGYRVTAGGKTIFYAPDLVYIYDRSEALSGAVAYVGDGATLARPMVRKRGESLIGHAPMRTQLTWCQKELVPAAIFTHCGSHIVGGDEDAVVGKLEEMARERGVAVAVAFDGMEIEFP